MNRGLNLPQVSQISTHCSDAGNKEAKLWALTLDLDTTDYERFREGILNNGYEGRDHV